MTKLEAPATRRDVTAGQAPGQISLICGRSSAGRKRQLRKQGVAAILLGVTAVSTAGCARSPERPEDKGPAGLDALTRTAELTSDQRQDGLGTGRAAQTHSRNGLSWYDDAPEDALRAGRDQRKPILVELWAPWCHTCLSMKNFVITRENVPALEKDFVLLAIDTEKEQNAAFLERFPVGVWPTFYVLGSNPSESTGAKGDATVRYDTFAVAGRWLGGASASQLQHFVRDSARAALQLAALQLGQTAALDPLLAELARGDALAMQGQHPAAAAAYGQALALAPLDWPRRPETLVAQITALWKSKSLDACLALGNASLAQTGSSASAIDFAHYAIACAEGNSSPLAEPTRRLAEARLSEFCQRGSPELSPDDRADACDNVSWAREALGDAKGAREAKLRRLAVIEQVSLDKPIEVAVAYDWARTDALIALDRAGEAIPFLIAHERQLPNNYNPPQQLARCYKALGRWEDGLAAIRRAISLAYGPRRAAMATLHADLLLALERNSEARQVVAAQLTEYRSLPAGQRQIAAEERTERRLRDWGADATP